MVKARLIVSVGVATASYPVGIFHGGLRKLSF